MNYLFLAQTKFYWEKLNDQMFNSVEDFEVMHKDNSLKGSSTNKFTGCFFKLVPPLKILSTKKLI